MNRRTLVAKGGASAFALTLAGLAANRAVNAQDATPVPGTSTDTGNGTGGTTTQENPSATTYQEFVAALATNLNITDSATVDTAIRTTLKGFVDDELAAGDLAANAATAMKEAIDASDSPIRVGGFGRHEGMGGMRGGMPGDMPGHRGQDGDTPNSKPWDDDSGSDGDDSGNSTSGVDATPTTTA